MSINTATIKDTIINFLVPLVALGVCVLVGFVVIWPYMSALPSLREELQQKRDLAEQLSDKLAKLNTLADFKGTVGEDEELITKVLVSDAAVPELLTQIDTIGKEAGLQVTKLSYSFDESAAGKTAPAAKDGKVEEAPAYDYVIVTYGTLGTYAQLKTFLSVLEGSARFVDAESLRYSLSAESGEKNQLDITLVLKSPFRSVESSAVTDDPILFDIASEEFLGLLNGVKKLKLYEFSPDAILSLPKEATEASGSTPAD